MKVRDKSLKKDVDVMCKECPTYQCYWPRPNPGIFTQGVGYRKYGDARDNMYLCGTREIRGCPDNPKPRTTGA